ncbi:hypothetical protein Q9Q95_08475 [Sphingomonas sp. DG1-23]|uniref:hypothetical protein n=1 Tax=Sphingomonas sp. DG1-23 TaxID=3068316 RepID=UPI00273D254F|nr:hypothetical protein [Sphingomonas sp. DG1-23]MDP5278955.1 hypothetical protein [Sphingomonas sp. DG1-23]
MRRRDLVRMMAAAGVASTLPRAAFAGGSAIQLGFDPNRTGATIPRDFIGLSFERAQLSNPGYFSADNKQLVALVRGLSPAGNLRLGGSSGEHTDYIGDTDRPLPFEIFGPEHNKSIKHGMFVSTAALRTLRGFLDATGWSCLYGLNLAHATPEQAAREAADVQRILGPRLRALQIGNEPDAFRNRFRPAAWGPRDFLAEWDRFHSAIAAAAPGVKFAGPDISNKLDYLTAFAQAAPRYPDVIMLTGHYYAMGPAGSPDATLDQLMEPDPKTTTLKLAGVETVQAAVRAAGLPYRMAEGNSCWDGGKIGVSDVHAAAIWGADTMLRFARRGWIGVNWHGGGNGNYSPIVGTPSKGFTRRPLYFGTRFAQALDGATFLDTGATPDDPYLGYYALRHAGRTRIAVINKSDTPVQVQLPGVPEPKRTILTGPSASARDATTLTQRSQRPERNMTIPPLTAILLTLGRGR